MNHRDEIHIGETSVYFINCLADNMITNVLNFHENSILFL